jgi:2-amino-4-hydroxy-6-hydroxymethyldihydropteridine diphosphokinase
MRDPVIAYLGLGANLGNAPATLLWAIQQLRLASCIEVLARSSLYRSAPIDAGGPDFANAVLEIRTVWTAPELLQRLHGIEAAAGRERPYRNAPRTLDLDVLLYGGASITSAALTIPHPRMLERAFVLHPLAELAPQHMRTEALQRLSAQVINRIEWPEA